VEVTTRISVVLVDDSARLRELIRRRLESTGAFEVVAEGSDGDQAIVLGIRYSPALLLLDASMPHVDGIEALPAIVAACPDTKVVMLTGFEEPGLREMATELGAAGLLEKSVPLGELPSRLMRILGGGHDVPGTRAGGLRVVPTGGEPPVASEEQRVLDQHLLPFRELFDRAAIGMATLTAHGTVVRANAALASLMSCHPADLVGVDYGRLTTGRGDDLDRALECISTGGEDLAMFEHPLPTFPGGRTPGHVRATLTPIRDAKGQVLYVFAQIQDISALRAAQDGLRRSEEHFRLLVSAVGEYAIFMLDIRGHVLSWNAGAERIKRYAAEDIIGRSFRVFYLPEEQASGHPEHNLEVALREGQLAEEGWRVRKDGTRFWASVVISPVFDDEGQHIGFAKVTRDQTDQQAVEQERRGALAEQTHLLAVTAHELRNPAAVIEGSAAVLGNESAGMSDVEQRTVLAGIRGSAHRLRRLADDLATASRLTGETLDLQLSEVSLAELLGTAAARAEAAEPGVRIQLEIPHGATVQADAMRLGQALDNLLDNAVRHGLAPVRLSARAEAGLVVIRVADAGPGVPPELLPRLFERYTTGGRRGGTGLGLYLVREIAHRHGGEAEYHAPSAAPTTFEIRLPLGS
jgi:PAS domain S-box-containing protein